MVCSGWLYCALGAKWAGLVTHRAPAGVRGNPDVFPEWPLARFKSADSVNANLHNPNSRVKQFGKTILSTVLWMMFTLYLKLGWIESDTLRHHIWFGCMAGSWGDSSVLPLVLLSAVFSGNKKLPFPLNWHTQFVKSPGKHQVPHTCCKSLTCGFFRSYSLTPRFPPKKWIWN